MTRTKLVSALFLSLLSLSSCNKPQKNYRPTQPQQSLKQEPAKKQPGEKTTIALLLPLSGGAAEIGKSALDAAKMALFDLNAKDVVLKPYDCPGDSAKAQLHARSAIAESAEVILGPVFSTDARAIAPITQAAHIPVLSLSNTPEIATRGVYPLGYNPADQTRHVVQHLMSKGKREFAILAPNTRYTQLSVAALKEAIKGQGTLVREVYYDKSTNSFDLYVTQLTSDMTHVNFEALFIPERGEKLHQITEALKAKGITNDKIQFFGPDSWKEMAPQVCENLRNGLYASPDKIELEKFKSRFISTYGYCPADTASIAYDIVAMVATYAAAREKVTNDTLTNSFGFKGIDGPFRLLPEGTVQRHYAVFEVNNNGAQIILPPERDFQ